VLIGSRASFVAGLEVKLEMEPAEVIDELAKTCLGQISEMGGVFRMRVGAPAAPVQFITDDHRLGISRTREPLDLARGTAPVQPDLGGRGRRPPPLNQPELSGLLGCLSGRAADGRLYQGCATVPHPPPGSAIAWTSERNGYTNKIFELVEITDQPGTINQELVLRERDPSDYGWTSAQDLPAVVPVTGLSPRPPQIIAGWSVAASTLKDALGLDRRPAITLSWVGSAALDALFVRYEIRLKATAQVVASGLADRAAGSVLVSDGLLPEEEYEVRGCYVLDRPTEWSSWLNVTTPGIYLQGADLRGGLKGLLDEANLAPVEILASLPESGNVPGRVVFLTTDAKLYRWTGSAWSREIDAGDISGELGAPGSGTTLAGDAVIAGLISAGGISAEVMSVTQLSAITSDIGTATAGVIRSADGKFKIDLNAKTITITV